jgi:hypothetical protein
MPVPAALSSQQAIDLPRIWRLTHARLSRLRDLMDEERVSDEFERAELFLAWVAYFIPSAFDETLRDLAGTIRVTQQRRQDFGTRGWHRVLGLEAALFATRAEEPEEPDDDYLGEEDYLDNAWNNASHPNSGLRSRVTTLLALVVPRFPFEGYRVTAAAADNIRQHHDLHELGALVAACRGSLEDKQALLTKWWKDEGEVAGSPLLRLVRGEPVPNPFFERLAEINQNAIMVLASVAPETSEGPTSYDEIAALVNDDSVLPTFQRVAAMDLEQRLTGHPLLRPTIRLEQAPNAE